jgi:hypothetical protein
VRGRDESGFVGGLEALPFGFLVFVAGTLLLVNAWAVFDCHVAASAAAREAVRAFVESDGSRDEAVRSGEAAAAEALVGQGKQPGRSTMEWTGARLDRCQPVSVSVRYRVPLVVVPWIGSFGRGVLTTTARHQEIVDPLRRGLPTDGFEVEGCNV